MTEDQSPWASFRTFPVPGGNNRGKKTSSLSPNIRDVSRAERDSKYDCILVASSLITLISCGYSEVNERYLKIPSYSHIYGGTSRFTETPTPTPTPIFGRRRFLLATRPTQSRPRQSPITSCLCIFPWATFGTTPGLHLPDRRRRWPVGPFESAPLKQALSPAISDVRSCTSQACHDYGRNSVTCVVDSSRCCKQFFAPGSHLRPSCCRRRYVLSRTPGRQDGFWNLYGRMDSHTGAEASLHLKDAAFQFHHHTL